MYCEMITTKNLVNVISSPLIVNNFMIPCENPLFNNHIILQIFA